MESMFHTQSGLASLRRFAVGRGLSPMTADRVFRASRRSASGESGATTSDIISRADALDAGPEVRAVLAMRSYARENPGERSYGWLRSAWDFLSRSARIGAPEPVTEEKATWVARFFEERMGPDSGAHVVPVHDPRQGWIVEIRVAPREERRLARSTFLGVPVRTVCPGEASIR